MRKMSQLAKSDFEPDVLGAAIPGQSLTSNPGQFPYEKPPMTVDPLQATDALLETMMAPQARSTIGKLLDIGISAEMLASSYVLGGVAEGLFDVDVAEIVKPALILEIVGIGDNMGIEDINVLDTAPPQGLGDGQHIDLLSRVNPDKFDKRFNNKETDIEDEMMPEEENMMMENESPMSEGFISRPMEEV
tara:strand:- start:309 stop:878 length:570 start_codon:yes stop_codon:yes gene_type:complete